MGTWSIPGYAEGWAVPGYAEIREVGHGPPGRGLLTLAINAPASAVVRLAATVTVTVSGGTRPCTWAA